MVSRNSSNGRDSGASGVGERVRVMVPERNGAVRFSHHKACGGPDRKSRCREGEMKRASSPLKEGSWSLPRRPAGETKRMRRVTAS